MTISRVPPVRPGSPGDGPVLLAVAHGTRLPDGQRQVVELVDLIRARRPGLDVELAYLDVQQPRLDEVVRRLRRPAVAVPLLLAAGYHVRADIPAAVGAATGLSTGAVTANPIGPDPMLAGLLCAGLHVPGSPRPDAVVVAAAGSRDARAQDDVDEVTAHLGARLAVPVRAAYISAGTPEVGETVSAFRAGGARRVAIAAYLLADGRFYRTLHRAGADYVTAPLGINPMVAGLALTRYDQAVSASRWQPVA